MTLTDRGGELLRIGLLWHSVNAPNLGVGALTIANIEIARRAARRIGRAAQFTVIGFGNEAESYAPPDVVACHTVNGQFLLNRSGYLSVIDGLDCILDIGSGDSFSDIYGRKRFFYLWATKALALMRRKPLLLSPQTIGPFRKWGSATLAGAVVGRATLTVTRDRMSMKELLKIAPHASKLHSVDVAFALPFKRRRHSSHKRRIGLNVSGMLFNEASRRLNSFGMSYDYADAVRQILHRLAEDETIEIELISHVVAPDAPIDDDWAVARQLAVEFPSAILIEPFRSPIEAKSHIAGLDFLVSARMHACIAAFSAGVPFTALSYSRKFEGLFGMLEYPAIVPRDGGSASDVASSVLQLLDKSSDLSASIEQSSGEVRRLLAAYEDALANFFASTGK